MPRIDPHVHFRDEEQSYKETIVHGLSIAKQQGVDYVFDMPNTAKSILHESDVLHRLRLVPPSEKGRYFLYIGGTTDESQLKEAVRLVREIKEVIGIKMYAGKSTGNLAVLREEEQRKVYTILAKENYRGVLAVHCEKEQFMSDIFDPQNPISHALSRPKIAEIESLKDQIKMVKETGFQGVLHICHISCPEAVELVAEAKREMKIVCGVTPHHLLWDDSKLLEPLAGMYKMNPPLRRKEDVIKMRELLLQGKINWIETDHAPHTIGEKLHGSSGTYPSGYPSLYLYKELIEKHLPEWGLTSEEIERLTFSNIVQVFDLRL